MERQIPKNVRQIGNVSDTPKIYVEDYVDTFFSQLCDKAGESPVGAFLVGDIQSTEDEEYVYIYGAIQMHELKLSGTEYVLDEDTWKHAYEDCKQYFEDGEMLGWFVAHAGVPLSAEENVTALHKKSFPKKNTVFIIKDPGEKEEAYFVHKLDDLMEIGGHYTYYEKNPCMQNYMISARKKNGASPTETVEDQAAKDFRSIVRSREEQMMKQRSNRMMYALSTSLVLLVVIMGVATMNNFDKMRSVQNTLENLSGTVASDDGQVQQTDGKVSSSGTPAASGEAGAQGDAGTDGNDQAQPDGQAPGQNQPGGTAQDGQAQPEGQSQGGQVQADGQTQEGQAQSGGQSQGGSDQAGSQAAGENGQAGGNAADAGNGAQTPQEPAVETSGGALGEGNPEGSDGSGTSAPAGNNGSDGIYVVEQGDTLAIISQKLYGDISHVDAISRMNGLTDGNLIYIGQKLLLP